MHSMEPFEYLNFFTPFPALPEPKSHAPRTFCNNYPSTAVGAQMKCGLVCAGSCWVDEMWSDDRCIRQVQRLSRKNDDVSCQCMEYSTPFITNNKQIVKSKQTMMANVMESWWTDFRDCPCCRLVDNPADRCACLYFLFRNCQCRIRTRKRLVKSGS
jgi:hypothetical protein